jgi:hypothetical protein
MGILPHFRRCGYSDLNLSRCPPAVCRDPHLLAPFRHPNQSRPRSFRHPPQRRQLPRTGKSWCEPDRARGISRSPVEPGHTLVKGSDVAETFAVEVEEVYVAIETKLPARAGSTVRTASRPRRLVALGRTVSKTTVSCQGHAQRFRNRA